MTLGRKQPTPPPVGQMKPAPRAVGQTIAPMGDTLATELARFAWVPPHAITFTIPGDPATKGSTHSMPSRSSGKIITLANDKSLPAWTREVQWRAKAAGVRVVPKPRGVVVLVWLCFTRPASVSVAAREHMTVKPDVDKVLRATLDALTGIAYEDDSQVVTALQRKCYGLTDETILQIWEER